MAIAAGHHGPSVRNEVQPAGPGLLHQQGWELDGHRRPDNSALLGYRLTIPRQTR